MKKTKKMNDLLERMAKIERMERGKLCKMSGRSHYNHQTWQNGKNRVRYVRTVEKELLEEAIAGYNQFIHLAERYVDEVIRQTRTERRKAFPSPPKINKKA